MAFVVQEAAVMKRASLSMDAWLRMPCTMFLARPCSARSETCATQVLAQTVPSNFITEGSATELTSGGGVQGEQDLERVAEVTATLARVNRTLTSSDSCAPSDRNGV